MKNIIIAVLVILVAVVGYFMFVKKSGPLAYQAPTPTATAVKTVTPTANPMARWKTFTSAELAVSFKYPANYILMDRLNGEERAVLLGDKEFPKPEIAPWYHAPITISKYNESMVNDLVSTLAGVKRSTITVDGQVGNVIEGNYQDYPAPGQPANNHMKIIIIPNKNLTIRVQDSYAGTKSDWSGLLSVFGNILATFKFTK